MDWKNGCNTALRKSRRPGKDPERGVGKEFGGGGILKKEIPPTGRPDPKKEKKYQ